MADRRLEGRSVVVTRAEHQASSLSDLLEAEGATVVAVPVIAVAEPADGGEALRHALDRLSAGDWLVVTSANGVARVVDAATALGKDLMTTGASLAAIGPGTRDALVAHGLPVGLVPERFVAEGLLAAFPPPDGGHVVLAQASGARPVLADGLRDAGWPVEVVEAYRTVHPSVPPELIRRAAAADAVTFTSASTVRGFVRAAGLHALPPVVVTIGPVTTREADDLGVDVTAEADPHSLPGLVDALAVALEGRSA